MDRLRTPEGFTLLELLLAVSITVAVLTMSVPMTMGAVDEVRAAMAARYVQGRIMNARMTAVKRSARIGLRFETVTGDYAFGEYADGNGNGVRAPEISSGVDPQLAPRLLLRDQFPQVRFGLLGSIPDLDGVRSSGETDGVRIGSARILTLGPDGTATSGTLYLHSRRGQFAIRVLGATGRTRVFRFEAGTQRWASR